VNKNEKQLVKEQPNKELLLNSPSVSGKKTKLETTLSPNELIDIEIFKRWLDNLDSPRQEAYLDFSRETYSAIECFLYARFLGYKGAINGCISWINQTYPKPDHRKSLLHEIEEMKEDIKKLRIDIENMAVKRDVGVARIASMQKELRSTISQVETYTANRDKRGLLLAGADIAIKELLSVFKEDPIEGPIEEASMSVWAKIQTNE
jgi:hypothetical protein